MAMTSGNFVVTGASTGIGRACSLRLTSAGHRVFAGVRRAEDGEALRREGGDRLVPILLDVTREASMESAAKSVQEAVGTRGLQGLVNNAGVVVAGPLEFLELDALRTQLEINVVGVLAVTRALLPAIRRGGGRIVNMGSMGGYLALPFVGAYNASKFAIEAMSDSLRRELRPWRIPVSVIEPGAVRSRIWEKSLDQAREIARSLPEAGRALYGERIPAVTAATEATARGAIPAERVARAVEHALTARRPRTRYPVGRDARLARWLVCALPDRLLDAVIARQTEARRR